MMAFVLDGYSVEIAQGRRRRDGDVFTHSIAHERMEQHSNRPTR
jgi:hypothetical protein